MPPAWGVGAQSLNHWTTREVPQIKSWWRGISGDGDTSFLGRYSLVQFCVTLVIKIGLFQPKSVHEEMTELDYTKEEGTQDRKLTGRLDVGKFFENRVRRICLYV